MLLFRLQNKLVEVIKESSFDLKEEFQNLYK